MLLTALHGMCQAWASDSRRRPFTAVLSAYQLVSGRPLWSGGLSKLHHACIVSQCISDRSKGSSLDLQTALQHSQP